MTSDVIPYRAAGTFDGESYVERKADVELASQIRRNQRFPYIVAARQSGKSSLIIRMIKTLDPASYVCAFVDLAPMVIEDYRQFWQEFLLAVAKSGRLDRGPLDKQDPEDTLRAWLEQVEPRRLLVFVDEIDALLAASFREQFFSKIRTFFNNRAIDRVFSRLQFILVGSAHPSSLITDPKRSPFNVGIEVMLDELSEEQLIDLTSHLADSGAEVAAGVARRIYAYTSGSVYLSQLILEHLWGEALVGLERGKAAITEVDVETSVEWVVAQAARNVHFENIFRLVKASKKMRQSLRRLESGESIGEKERQALQLAGISTGERAFRNQIYERVFGSRGPLRLQGEVTQSHRGVSTRVQLKAGATLMGGKYRLVRKIGQGGFGAVWMALEAEAERQVAIKVLHAHFSEDAKRRERFFRGAREMARLGHRAIVEVIEPHGEQGGDCFFVMEYVKGHDFRDAIKQRFVRTMDVVTIITEVGEALAHAHASGLIHRDVKPSNILLDAHRLPRLTDFDLVRVSDQTGGTQTGAMGTFLYTAPEVMKEAKEADVTADIYSLAMTAVFGLYGKDLPMEVLRDAGRFIDHNLNCNAAVKAVLKRAVTWQKEARYADASMFCRDLVRAWETGQLPTWAVTPKPEPVPIPAAKTASVIPPLTRGAPAPKRARKPAPSASRVAKAEIPERLVGEEATPRYESSFDSSAGLPAPPTLSVSDDVPSLVTSAGLLDSDADDELDPGFGTEDSSADRSVARGFGLDAPATVLDEFDGSSTRLAQQHGASATGLGRVGPHKKLDEEEAAAEQAALVALVTGAVATGSGHATPPSPSLEPTSEASGPSPESRPEPATAVVPGDVVVATSAPGAANDGSTNRSVLLFVCMVVVLFLVFRLYDADEIPQPVLMNADTQKSELAVSDSVSPPPLATGSSTSPGETDGPEPTTTQADASVSDTNPNTNTGGSTGHATTGVEPDETVGSSTMGASQTGVSQTGASQTGEVVESESMGSDAETTDGAGEGETSATSEATGGEEPTTTSVPTTSTTETGADSKPPLSVNQLISKGCRDVRTKKRAQRGVDYLLEAYDEGAGDNVKMRRCLGQGYLALGKPRSALRHYESALVEDFNNRDALFGAAQALEKMSKQASRDKLRRAHIEQAIRYYRRCLSDASTSAKAKQAISRLQASLGD